jgi:hypothetical protein
MKRLVYLAMAALMALVIFVPTATAQEMTDGSMMDESMMMDESNMMNESMTMEQPKMMDDSMMEQSKMEQPNSMEKGKMEQPKKMEMPMTGGPSLGLLLLPAAALLAGMGLMAGYVVRRRG